MKSLNFYRLLNKILSVIFMIIAGILLMNTLIAMMGNTYAKINETKNEWIRQVCICLYSVKIL